MCVKEKSEIQKRLFEKEQWKKWGGTQEEAKNQTTIVERFGDKAKCYGIKIALKNHWKGRKLVALCMLLNSIFSAGLGITMNSHMRVEDVVNLCLTGRLEAVRKESLECRLVTIWVCSSHCSPTTGRHSKWADLY